MTTPSITMQEDDLGWRLPDRGTVAMYCLIAAEVAIFTIFVVAYIFYLGKSAGPQPRDVLHLPIFITVCLLSSSLTIHRAVASLGGGNVKAFGIWWFLTLALGSIFLLGTFQEWRHLIYDEGVTLQSGLFGTTYYSLVGLHAFHVTVGLLALAIVLIFTVRGDVGMQYAGRAEVLSLYWHFVDVVWVVVFTVVYIVGR